MDNDPIAFPSTLLRTWKQDAEKAAEVALGRTEESPTLFKEFRRLRDAVVGPLHTRTPAMAEQLRREIEEANPDLRVRITYEENKRTYAFGFKEGITRTDAGVLRFPDTDAGRTGSAKVTRARDYGTTEELGPGEFVFAPTVKVPEVSAPVATGHLTIGPSKPPRSFEVRIDATIDARPATLISMTTLIFKRLGRKEAELEISGGLLAGTLTIIFTLDRTVPEQWVALNMDLGSLPAQNARNTIFLAQSMARGDLLSIVPFDPANPSLTAFGFNIECPSDDYDAAADFLRDLGTISDEFKKDLRYPESPDEQTIQNAWTLATAITEGTVVVKPEARIEATIRGEAVALARSAWSKNEPFSTRYSTTENMSFLGHDFDLGRVLYKLYDVQPSPSSNGGDLGEGELRVTIGSIRKVFDRWHRRSTLPDK